jgi:hypothetical protein
MAQFLVKMMPAMRRFCGRNEVPFIGYLQPGLTIKLVMNKDGLVVRRKYAI